MIRWFNPQCSQTICLRKNTTCLLVKSLGKHSTCRIQSKLFKSGSVPEWLDVHLLGEARDRKTWMHSFQTWHNRNDLKKTKH